MKIFKLTGGEWTVMNFYHTNKKKKIYQLKYENERGDTQELSNVRHKTKQNKKEKLIFKQKNNLSIRISELTRRKRVEMQLLKLNFVSQNQIKLNFEAFF